MKSSLILTFSICASINVIAQNTFPSSGNVGIGTPNPQVMLDVFGPVRFNSGRLTHSGDLPNDNNATFVNTASTGYGIYSKGGAGTRYSFHFENQEGVSVLIGKGNGNIGIGTVNPQAKLDVFGPVHFNSGRLTHSGDLPNDNNATFVNTASTGYGIYSKGGAGTRYSFHFENREGVSVLIGKGNGNIGIGTVNPQAKLDVVGPVRFNSGRLTHSGDLPNDNNATFVNTASTGYGIYSKGGAGTRYSFHFENQQGLSVLYGRGDGKIGVGTIAPDSKLTVKGDIHAEEVRVDLTVPGPDYVFEENYDLPTLESIESYIQENKHLPEIPSARELEADGIDLGVMNMLLLKKVEELTLHLIEQDRRIQELEAITIQNNIQK